MKIQTHCYKLYTKDFYYGSLDLDPKDLSIKDEHNLENPNLLLSSEGFFFEDLDYKYIQFKDEDSPF